MTQTLGVVSRIADVTAFGALGDGSDCTSSVQAAAASLTSGGVLYFPTGTYAIASSVAINLDDVTIHGDGWGSTIQFTHQPTGGETEKTASLFVFRDGINRVTVRDLRLTIHRPRHLHQAERARTAFFFSDVTIFLCKTWS